MNFELQRRNEDFSYFKKELNLLCNYENLNENFLTDLVDEKLQQIDMQIDSSVTQYNIAYSFMEWWLELNYSTFIETESVYRYNRKLCDGRNINRNLCRAYNY